MNKKKELIIRGIVAFILLVIVSAGTYAWFTWKEEKEPSNNTNTITENYNSTILKNVYKSEGKLYYDPSNQKISEEINDSEYYIGEFGKLYDSKVSALSNEKVDITKPYFTSGNYSLYYSCYSDDEDTSIDECLKYYYNNKTKVKSKEYNYIYPIMFGTYNVKSSFSNYFLIKSYDNDDNMIYSLFNSKTNKLIELNTSINYFYDDNSYNNYYYVGNNNTKYLMVANNKLKYGLIDYSGNVIINLVYDSMQIVNDNKFIVEKNNKFGIIDSKNNTLLSFDYNFLKRIDNYYIAIKNNKLAILDNNYKVIENYRIDIDPKTEFSTHYSDEGYINGYRASLVNNNFIIITYATSCNTETGDGIVNCDSTSSKYNNTYLVDLKGNVTKENACLNELYKDNNYDEYDYYYKATKNKNILTFNFYDKDLSFLYKYDITLKYNGNTDYSYEISFKNNFYKIQISYDLDDDIVTDNIYLDLKNLKEVSALNAEYKKFDNSYGYTLIDDKLTIYKEENVLSTYDNIDDYVGDYMFIKRENTSTNTTYSIEKIEFIKDSE